MTKTLKNLKGYQKLSPDLKVLKKNMSQGLRSQQAPTGLWKKKSDKKGLVP